MRVKLLFACAALLAVAGCVERRSPIEIKAHPESWVETSSVDFHGIRVEENGPAGCVGCHGADLQGSADVPGCNDCHDGAGGHPGTWANPASSPFHGDEVAAEGPTACAPCHASTEQGVLRYTGGWSNVSCFACHAGGPSGHPSGWLEERSCGIPRPQGPDPGGRQLHEVPRIRPRRRHERRRLRRLSQLTVS